MPARSKQQSKFMHLLENAKEGKTPMSKLSPKAQRAAGSMSLDSIKHYTKTKTKNLPEKVEKKSMWNELLKTANTTVLKANEKIKELDAAKKIKPKSVHTQTDSKKQIVVYNPEAAHNNFSKTTKSPKGKGLWAVIKKNPIKSKVIGIGALAASGYTLTKLKKDDKEEKSKEPQKKESLWKEIGQSLLDAPGRVAEFIPGLGYKTPYTLEAEAKKVPEQIKALHEQMMTQAQGKPYEESENIRRGVQDQIQQLHEQNSHHQQYDNAGWGATGLGIAGVLGGAGLYDSITRQPQQPQEQFEQPMQQKYSLWKEAIRGDYARAALGALKADDWNDTNTPSQGLQDYSKGSRQSKAVADLIRTKRKTNPEYLFQQRNLDREVLKSFHNQDSEEMNKVLRTKLTPKENAWWLTPAAERDDAWDAKHRPRTVDYRVKQKAVKEKQIADEITNKRNALKNSTPHWYNSEHPYYKPEIDPDNPAYNPMADPVHPSYDANRNRSPSTSEVHQPTPKPSKGLWNLIKRNPLKTTGIGLGAAGLAGVGAYALSRRQSKTQPQEKKALLGAAIEGLNMVGVPMMAYKALRQFGVPLKNYFPEAEAKSFWQAPMKKTVRGIGQSIYKDDMVPSVASGIAPMLTMPLADYAANLVDPQPQQQDPNQQQY